jgi:hypothetical protein
VELESSPERYVYASESAQQEMLQEPVWLEKNVEMLEEPVWSEKNVEMLEELVWFEKNV